MTNRDFEDMMLKTGVRPSPVRLLVLKALYEAGEPIASQDIESRLETVDRSSINRSLAMFDSKGLLHTIDDGSGVVKYEFCHACGGHEHHDDRHPHFHCTQCGKTYCFDSVAIPEIEMPEGFEANSVNYVVKGVCASCSARNLF